MLKGNLEGNKDVQVQSNLRKKQHSVIQRGATFSSAPLMCARFPVSYTFIASTTLIPPFYCHKKDKITATMMKKNPAL